METYFEGFHEEEQFSTNSLLCNGDEVIKDQLGALESIKIDDGITWEDECVKNQCFVGKEDFQQIMSDWQQHVGLLQSPDTEDLGLGLGLDANLDTLNTFSNSGLFEEKESPILSKALKCSVSKNVASCQQMSKLLGNPDFRSSFFCENLNYSNNSVENSKKLCGLVKSEPNLIRRVTLLNGEKEILGKNIIGLHCLNEIKENPDENCQVASTVINGKRYKIIIKPKSLKVKKLSEEKIRKTLIKKLLQCNLVTKVEPKEDEIISEMRNGNYDVPILDGDLLPSWEFGNLDSDSWNQVEDELDNVKLPVTEEEEPVKKVPPLRIKVPKTKKHKKKKMSKSDEEVDVETVSEKVLESSSLSSLLKSFEEEMAKIQKEEPGSSEQSKGNEHEKRPLITSENIKNSLPKEMIEKIEALKRKKDHRIPLIQAMPSKKLVKNCTRMHDAVVTMNRNKLLKIVSGGDTVQLDHDYCSTFNKNSVVNKQAKKFISLTEKNPKKDSGMESGDVSDASESAITPDSSKNIQSSNVKGKIVEQNQIKGNEVAVKASFVHSEVSNLASNNVNNSDLVKTKTVSNGTKALTNCIENFYSNSDNSVINPSDTKSKSESYQENNNKNIKENANEERGNGLPDTVCSIQSERPKRKLKLEEYLSRRNVRDREKHKNSSTDQVIVDKPTTHSEKVVDEETPNNKFNISKTSKDNLDGNPQITLFKDREKSSEGTIKKEEKEKKNWKAGDRRSSSLSSGERRERRRLSRSRSRSRWRSSSNSSSSRRREERGRHRSRRSVSREKKRKRNFWSSSLSRSPSSESSSSSDSSSKRYKTSTYRYRRSSRSRSRSRSRSFSRDRSKSRNRVNYYRRRPNTNYYNSRNMNNRRSRSPFYAYSMREKQRQIEERRVIYVGRIEEGMTNSKLRERFSAFGPIIDISLHFREFGDNYGFVTYAYKADAYDAVEHGNDDPNLPRYDLCFGGRRGFCKEKYADLDGMPTSYSGFNDTPSIRNANESFDLLLKEAQAKLKNRKKL